MRKSVFPSFVEQFAASFYPVRAAFVRSIKWILYANPVAEKEEVCGRHRKSPVLHTHTHTHSSGQGSTRRDSIAWDVFNQVLCLNSVEQHSATTLSSPFKSGLGRDSRTETHDQPHSPILLLRQFIAENLATPLATFRLPPKVCNLTLSCPVSVGTGRPFGTSQTCTSRISMTTAQRISRLYQSEVSGSFGQSRSLNTHQKRSFTSVSIQMACKLA
jgi:hypothetical protein